MKKPEEIKAALLRYINAGKGTCLLENCPLETDIPRDALTYIEQLEEQLAKQNNLIDVLEEENDENT